jgi:hypothetical protein
MLTIFAMPKPFEGHIATIQRNAITSWTLLNPRPEIILFGEENGVSEIARELGLRHIPKVNRNEYGTPLLNDLFDSAQNLAVNSIVCYVNADIVLLSDFSAAVKQIVSWRPRFLMIGRRWDVDITEPLNFTQAGWELSLRSLVLQRAVQRTPDWIDYFVFPRSFYKGLAPFAIGRLWWDNWLVWKAFSLGAAVVDASSDILAVHQNHSYARGSTYSDVWVSEEAQRNRELAGMGLSVCTMADATHVLAGHEIKPNRGSAIRRMLRGIWRAVLSVTRPLRHSLGLHQKGVSSLLAKLGMPR